MIILARIIKGKGNMTLHTYYQLYKLNDRVKFKIGLPKSLHARKS